MKVTRSHTNSDGLWVLIAGHVDGSSRCAGADDQRFVQQIQLHQDVTGRGTIVVVHLDLNRLGRISLCDLTLFTYSDGSREYINTAHRASNL